MRRNTRRTTKRNSKTVISLRSPTPSPRPLQFLFRGAFRMVLLGLCVSAALCLGGLAAAGANPSPPDTKHETPYALIFGTVWGPDDHPVYAAKIKIRRE